MKIEIKHNGIRITQRDRAGNLFSILYQGFTLKQAKAQFKTDLSIKNNEYFFNEKMEKNANSTNGNQTQRR